MKIVVLIVSLLFYVTNVFAEHLEAKSHDNIVYFLSSHPNIISRYDMNSEDWLSAINLYTSGDVQAIEVGDAGIYVAYDRVVYSYDLEGHNQTHVTNTPNSISDLISIGNYLIVSQSGTFKIIDQLNLALTETVDSSYYTTGDIHTGLSGANKLLRLFGRSTDLLPGKIGFITLDNNGVVTLAKSDTHFGEYLNASKTWVFPDETKVVDDGGTIYDTQSLQYVGNFTSPFDLMTFVEDVPVLVREKELIAYSENFLEIGSFTIDSIEEAISQVDEIFSNDTNIFVFAEIAQGYSVQKIHLSQFSELLPSQTTEPEGLIYSPDQYVLDEANDTLFILNKANASVFRWSIHEKKYLESIPLLDSPEYMTVDTLLNIIYLAYQSGKITKIDLQQTLPHEVHLTSLNKSPSALTQVGSYLFVIAYNGPRTKSFRYLINPLGEITPTFYLGSHDSKGLIWNEMNNRLYSLGHELFSVQIDITSGIINNWNETSFYGDEDFILPMRFSPDGNEFILGTGRIYDTNSRQMVNSLPINIFDATWVNDSMITLAKKFDTTVIQFWSPSLDLIDEISVNGGRALRVFSVKNKILLIRSFNGTPDFELFDINNIPDNDGDGFNNLIDNCPRIFNIKQLDNDSDRLGNVCDADMDNDGLLNDFEVSIGLDPSKPVDAHDDLDSDGFSNLDEFKKGTDPKDSNSVPPTVSKIKIDFEDGIMPDFLVKPSSASTSWIVANNYSAQSGSKSMRAQSTIHELKSSIQWTSYFKKGVLEFDFRESNGNQFGIYIDNKKVANLPYYVTEWTHYSIHLTTGEHTIEWRYQKGGIVSTRSDTFWVDNISYLRDIDPILSIKVNGLTDSLMQHEGQDIAISISMDPETDAGRMGDWWAAAVSPFGVFWLDSQLQWVKSSYPVRAYAGPLITLSDFNILEKAKLPRGKYTFYFAVDTENNVLDVKKPSMVEVIID